MQQGYLPESTLDTALIRLFTARMKLGMFDPPEMVPYTKIDEKELDSAEHRALARKLANEAMVLLKNDGLLPLKPGIKKIAVVGPLADQTRPLLGNYAGQPTHIVSVLDGLKAEFPNATITYVPGTQFLRNDGDPVPDHLLTTPDGKPGLKADYGEWMSRPPIEAGGPPLIVSRTEPNVNLTGNNLPAGGCREESLRRALDGIPDGHRIPATTSSASAAMGFGRLSIDDKQVAMLGSSEAVDAAVGRVHLEKGQKAALSLTYGTMDDGKPQAQLIWTKVNDAPSPEAIAAAKNADVVIAVVGITSRLEGEEMPVTDTRIPGRRSHQHRSSRSRKKIWWKLWQPPASRSPSFS